MHDGRWLLTCTNPFRRWRHEAREGTLPPVLLWWVSGLDCHLILDGHARLAAVMAESVEPPLLQLHRTVAGDDPASRTGEAVDFYEYELARFAGLRAVYGPTVPDGAVTAGPQLVRLLHDASTAERLTWAWPLPGGEARWRRIAHKVTNGQDWPRTCALPHSRAGRCVRP